MKFWGFEGSFRALARLFAFFAVLLFGHAAQAQIFVNKTFSPTNVVVGQPTTLTVTVLNNSITPATAVAVTDTFPTTPAGLKVATGGLLSNDCGGTVSAVVGATSVSLTGGSVAASVSGVSGTCSFTVRVVATPASAPTSIVNTIPASNVSSSIGPGSGTASATLGVATASPITGNKVFAPATLQGNGVVSRMTIQLNNANSFDLTNVAFTDTFPTQMIVAPTPNVVGTCGGTVTAAASAVNLKLANGIIPSASNCTISVDLVASNPTGVATNAVVTNSIAIGAVTSAETITNAAVISGTVTVQKGAAVTKSFSPASILAGGTSTLSVNLVNYNMAAISGINIADTLPAGVTITALGTSSCGGLVTFTSAKLALTGGALAAAPAGGSSTCTMTATVTAPAGGTYTNTVPAGTMGGVAFTAGSAVLTVTNGVTVSKAFSPTPISVGGSSTLTITMSNTTASILSGFSLTDNLPTNITTNGTATTTCGGVASATSTSVTVTGGTLAAGTTASPKTCTLKVSVTGIIPGAYVNTIPTGNLAGVIYAAASGTLVIRAVSVTKAFSLTPVPRSGTSLLTLTLANSSTASVAAITSVTDALSTMGAGFSVAATPAPSTTCGGTITATPGATSFSMSGGTIPKAATSAVPGTCTVTVPVLAGSAATIASHTNTVAVDALVTDLGTNPSAATAAVTVVTPMSLSKAFSPTIVGAGGITRLTVTVTRVANADVFSNFTIIDPLPAGFKVAPTPNAATTCGAATFNATAGATSTGIMGGTLGSAASISSAASCTFSVDIAASTILGTYTNTIPIGNVTAVTAGGTVANTVAASATVQVVSSVAVNKSFNPSNTTPGGISVLTVFLANNGASAINLTGVNFTDSFPAGLVIAATPNASFVATSGTCSGTVSAVAGGTSLGFSAGVLNAGSTCELKADVTTAAIGGMTNVINPGTLTSTQSITNTNNVAASLVSSGNSDVSVTKTNGVTQQTAGLSTSYTIVVTNNSASTAVVGIPIDDTPPAGMTFTGWTCSATSGSSCTAASGTGALSTSVSLAKLGSATYTVTALLDSAVTASSITNTATLSPLAAGINDTDSSNDSVSDTDTIIRRADLSITKAVNIASPIIGDDVQFSITVSNTGPSMASAVAVNDALPAGYTFVSATANLGNYSAPVWTIGDLGAGATATLTITATVNAAGPYINQAVVSSSTTDPVTSNNTAQVSTTPQTASLTITKSVTAPTVANGAIVAATDAGDVVSYSFSIKNTGTSTLANVTPVDAGPTFNGSAGTGTMGAFSPASVTLAPNATQVFTADYTLSDLDVANGVGVTGAVANTANASALTTGGKTIAATAPSSASTMIVGSPGLTIVKDYTLADVAGGTAGKLDVGEIVTYTYTVSNSGNVRIAGVQVADDHNNHTPDLGPTQINGEVLVSNGPLSLLATPITSSDAANDGIWDMLQPGAVIKFTYVHTVTQAEIDGAG